MFAEECFQVSHSDASVPKVLQFNYFISNLNDHGHCCTLRTKMCFRAFTADLNFEFEWDSLHGALVLAPGHGHPGGSVLITSESGIRR